MEVDLREVNAFITEERKKKQMTKKDLCEAAGIHKNTLTLYETKNQYPDFKCFIKILNGLGYSATISLKPLEDGELIAPFSCDGCLFKNGSYCSHHAKAISTIKDCPYQMD